MRKLFTLSLFIAVSLVANAQIYWDFATAAPTSGVPANLTVSDVSAGNNFGTVTLLSSTSASNTYSGASASNNAGVASFAATGVNTALDVTLTGTASTTNKSNAYYEFTLTPATDYEVSITSIQFGVRSTGTGPQAYSIRSNKDNYATELANGTISNNSTWSLKSSTLSVSSTSALTIRIYTYNGIGNAGSGTANCRIDDLSVTVTNVLPVTLKSLKASLINNAVDLNWATSNETNFDYFGVEKSFDAKNFSPIAKVASNKTTNGSNYAFTDFGKTLAQQYYRLKMVDNDGSFKYSQVVAVNGKASTSLEVFPNPVVNTVIMSHPKAAAGATIRIVSVDGRSVSVTPVQTGATQTSIDVTRFVKSNYIASFEDKNEKSTVRFTKQ